MHTTAKFTLEGKQRVVSVLRANNREMRQRDKHILESAAAARNAYAEGLAGRVHPRHHELASLIAHGWGACVAVNDERRGAV